MKAYKLVIVENDEDERFFIKEALKDLEQFELIGEFTNGDTWLEWLGTQPAVLPDIILSDLNMPGKNGYDLLTDTRSNHLSAHIPIIITSTSAVKAVRDRCLGLGAMEYMVKPDLFIDYGPYLGKLYLLIQQHTD
jgi:CheY-like chemotaxis protein